MAGSSFLDVCRFIPTAGGTTDWTYSSAVGGYQGPSAAGAVNGAQYSYRAESADLTQWEVGFGTYNSSTGVFTRSTVLFNSSGTTSKISFTAVPQVAIIALSEDTIPIGGANGIFQATPSGAPSTTSTTQVMAGLGSTCAYTPKFSSRLEVRFQGYMRNTTNNGVNLQLRQGTGTAPAANASPTGTAIGNPLPGGGAAGAIQPFSYAGIITGLAIGTACWFDIGFWGGGGTVDIGSLSFSAREV